MDDRVATTTTPVGGSADTRRFVTAPDGRVLGEYGANASDVKAEFIWMHPQVGESGIFGGDDGLGGYMPLAVAANDNNGVSQLNWVHGNHMGVPIYYSDASGAQLATPTGYAIPGFPGQSRTFTDLYYNRYRDYDSSTGRYVQADPIGLAGGQSPYSYALNNPLRYTDPTGEIVPIVIAGVCAAGGCEALAVLGTAALGYAYYEWNAHNPYNPMGPNTCYLHSNRGGSGGRGGGIFGNPPLTDNEPGDDCDVEYKQEMEYCERKFGVSSSQYGLCKSRAGANLGLCKSGGRSLGWWIDEHMDGLKTPQRPSPKRRRW
jgi:RHS repeat-associated protein